MLSIPIETLVKRLKQQKTVNSYPSSREGVINVNKLTEKAGAAYEKLRYLIDYKDEKHIRRSAIERIIKRKLMIEGGGDGIGLSLIQELIAGQYLPNNAISENTSADVDRIIHRYIKLHNSIPESFRRKSGYKKILYGLIGSEIESFFYPNNENDFVAEALYETVKDSVKTEVYGSDSFFQTQILVACYRSLLNADDETLFYKLWLKYLPQEWSVLEDDKTIAAIGEKSPHIWSTIHSSLENPFNFKLLPKLNDYSIYFSVIREIVRVYGAESEQIFSNPSSLREFIKEFLEKNYKIQYIKAKESAIRAVFYIFVTKMLLALAIEVPYQIYFVKSIEYVPTIANVVFHPILLFLVTASVRPLGNDNTNAIIAGVENVLNGGNVRVIKVNSGGGGFFNSLFLMTYGILFLLVFGSIIFALLELHWSVVSIILFLSFLTLVSYFAIRIRHNGNKWRVTKEEDRILNLMFNLFALPIVRAGKWLSRKFSSINLFVFILDFIIETPFKLILRFGDEFTRFLKEKQEDVY